MHELGQRETEESKLIESCKRGNRNAQERLYRLYSKPMYHVCIAICGDRDEAKDILQEAFIKVFRSLGKYEGKGALEGWIRRIVHNTAIDYYRKNKPLQFCKEEITDQVFTEGKKEHIPENMKTDAILACIKKLPDGARLVFNMFAIEGYSHKEIAQQLSISEGTSKSQYNRARNLLQEWINRADEVF